MLGKYSKNYFDIDGERRIHRADSKMLARAGNYEYVFALSEIENTLRELVRRTANGRYIIYGKAVGGQRKASSFHAVGIYFIIAVRNEGFVYFFAYLVDLCTACAASR